MRIVAISDTHNQHKKIKLPYGDILIHSGDFSNMGYKHEIESFANWFSKQIHPIKILVYGNHEVSTDKEFYNKRWREFHNKKIVLDKDFWDRRNIIVLCGDYIDINGIKIWGHPLMPWNHNDWAWSRSVVETNKILSNIPKDIDIIITHSPPYGILDNALDGSNIGNKELIKYIKKIKPLICIFGHVHRPGYMIDNNIRYYNVAMCDDIGLGPLLIYKPTVIEI